RILPAYFAVVALFTAAGLAAMLETLPWNVTFTTNLHVFASGEWPAQASHFWSLAVEEQFYLFWPLLVMLLPSKLLVPAIVILTLCAPLTRLLLALWSFNTPAITAFPLCALDFLGVGALLALYWGTPQLERLRSLLRPAA